MKAIVIGSGAGGSTAAMVLAEAGWDVTIVEKGRNYFGDLTSRTPSTLFSNDELKSNASRYFDTPDVDLEPRTFRRTAADATPLAVGSVNNLPSVVGGGTRSRCRWPSRRSPTRAARRATTVAFAATTAVRSTRGWGRWRRFGARCSRAPSCDRRRSRRASSIRARERVASP